MDRLKNKGADAKKDKVMQKKRLEDLLEKSKNEVLDSYKIKSMLWWHSQSEHKLLTKNIKFELKIKY